MHKHLYLAFVPWLAMASDIEFAPQPPVIDARGDDPQWQLTTWQPINVPLIGPLADSNDFSGQFKLLWDARHLYLLVQMRDDVLFDQTADPLRNYWDDDCLEIFIDEDASGGDHLYDFNAFAYHVALDNQVVDIGARDAQGAPVAMLFNHHVESRWRRTAQWPNGVEWELAISLFDDQYAVAKGKDNQPVTLTAGKHIGFMLAYCDNDGSPKRESFIGSHPIQARNGDKNLGYKDASVFGRYRLSDRAPESQ